MTARRRLAGLLLPPLLLSACSTVPYAGRSRLIAVSEAEEVRLGEEAFRETVAEGVRVEDDRADLLRRVGARVAAASGRPGTRWEFILLDSAEINAFALPGGKVVFTTGILPVCGDETGIAAVMAHEVAHVLARHGAERLSQAKLLEAGGTLLSAREEGAGGGILSTHPGGEERVLRIEELLPIAREEYRKTGAGHAPPPSGGCSRFLREPVSSSIRQSVPWMAIHRSGRIPCESHRHCPFPCSCR